MKALHDAGFDSSQINVLSKGDNAARQMVESMSEKELKKMASVKRSKLPRRASSAKTRKRG